MDKHGGNIYKYSPYILDFSSNINSIGLPEGVKQAIINNVENYSVYPDPSCGELVSALSATHGYPEECFVCGNGAADIIYRTVLAKKPRKALLTAPAFSEYESALRLSGSEIKYHYLDEEKNFLMNESIADDIDESIDIVFICNPANPSGVTASTDILMKIAEKCMESGAMLIVDECFMDFVEKEESLLPYLKDLPHVVVLKAFTKIYAMAGIRLGYSICRDTALNKAVKQTLQPWSVSTVAIKAGTAALKEKSYIEKSKKLNTVNLKNLIDGLKKIKGIKVYPGEANFVLFKCQYSSLFDKLLEMNVLIRRCANYNGLDETFYRAAVRCGQDNMYLLECMRSILDE